MMKAGNGLLALMLAFFITPPNAWASDGMALRDVEIGSSQEEIKRGGMVALQLCVLCHSLKYVKFRDLQEVGFFPNEIDRFRRGAELSQGILSTTTHQSAKRLFGMVPPDLSLMAKARQNGPRYIYSLLLAYEEGEDGAIENGLFPGIRMPDVLAYSIEEDERVRQELEQRARDVAAFLAWAADPRAQERLTLGRYVLAYLFLLTAMLYLVKRKTWAQLKGG